MPWDILTPGRGEGHPHLGAHSLLLASHRQQLFLQTPPNSAFCSSEQGSMVEGFRGICANIWVIFK